MRLTTFLLAGVLTVFATTDYALAQSAPEAFTLQGRLTDSDGNPISGQRDFTISLYDAASGGSIVGSPLSLPGVPVTDGVFTVELDFTGQSIDFARPLWLNVTIGEETLSPRTPVRAAPYAIDVLSGEGTSGFTLPFSGTAKSMGPAFSLSHADGQTAFYVPEAGTGLGVESASFKGVHVSQANQDGLFVQRAGDPAKAQNNAGADGLEVAGVEGDGVFVGYAGSNGVHVGETGAQGIRIEEAASDGVVVESAGGDGLRVNGSSRRAIAAVNESSGDPALFLRNKDTGGDLIEAKSGTDDDVEFRVDSEGRASNAVGAGMPVAYAVINRDGSIDRSTSNVSCERSGEEYIISIVGHALSETSYFALVQQTRPSYMVSSDGTEYPFMHPVQVYENGNLKIGFQEPDGDANPAASEFSIVLYRFF